VLFSDSAEKPNECFDEAAVSPQRGFSATDAGDGRRKGFHPGRIFATYQFDDISTGKKELFNPEAY